MFQGGFCLRLVFSHPRRPCFVRRGVSPPAGGEFLCPWRQSNQNATGDGSDEHFVLIVAYPTPSGPSGHLPLTGGVGPGPHYEGRITESFSKISGAQNLSGRSKSPPGHWALGLQKLHSVRFQLCAWLCRANAFGAYSGGRMLCAPTSFLWAVGAAISRPKTFLFRANSPYQGELSSAARQRG